MTEHKQMGDTEIKALVANEIRSSIAYDETELSKDRAKAQAYYDGRIPDMPAEQGRSSAVSMDVPDTIGWIKPGIIRVFTASEQMALCEPVRPADEQFSQQASDAINYIFWKDNDGFKILSDGTHDSLLFGNGIVKHFWDDTEESETTEHTGLTDDQLTQLVSDDDEIEVLAHSSEQEEQGIDPESGQPLPPLTLHSVKIKRVKSKGRVVVDLIPPEAFLIDSEAKSMADARFTGHKDRVTRSHLIEMGFDRAKVEKLKAGPDDSPEVMERQYRYTNGSDDTADDSMILVDLVECYVKADVDGDGIAETVRCYYAGDHSGGELLDWEIWDDDAPFTDIPCYPVPHRFQADSVFKKTYDVMRIKSALIRQALDNTYAANIPQRFVKGKLHNPDELFSPNFGGTVFGDASASIESLAIPFIANHAFDAINYQDQVIERRTGVSRTTMALDPEALQNQTATANQNAHDAAYSQIELIARNQAEGWRKVFRAILRLTVKHQDKARTIRLRDTWVEIDPRSWNSDMDITINVGLGTGSRDRDMQMLQGILQIQTNLADKFMVNGLKEEAIEFLPLIVNTAQKIAESSGIRTPEQFFPTVGKEQIDALKAKIKEQSEGGDPAVAAKQAAEQAKMQADQQAQQQRLQFEIEKAQAKMQFDIQLAQQKSQSDMQAKQLEFQAKIQQLNEEISLKREQLSAEFQMKREQFQQDIELQRELGHANVAAKAASANSTSGVHVGGDPG